jgi:hypothetical protein
MEVEGSLPGSQKPYTGRLALPSGIFPSGFPTNILYAILFAPFVLYALPISYFLTWSF